MKLKALLLGILLAAGQFGSSNLQAAAYLKLGDIKGEATDSEHKEWIIIESMSFEARRDVDPTTGLPGAAKLLKFGVVKEIDKSTPLLLGGLITGGSYTNVVIEFTKPVGSTGEQPYLRYELKDVLISSYSSSGDAGGSAEGDVVPVDAISLNFREIKVIYTEYDADGANKGNVEYSWKVEEGES